jgi:hypothetical protein
MYRILVALLMGLSPFLLRAQHQDVCEPPLEYKGKQQPARDTTSVLSAFKKGKVNGHFRYFFMATNNTGDLQDYYANAAGGGLRFETANFYGFQFGVGGSYIFNLGSSDAIFPDSTGVLVNRYEIGLFDIDHPESARDLDRLEELFLNYSFKNSKITFGRQFINTPFINLQDGRMRPTAVEGLVLNFNEVKALKIEAGFLYAISPRSTTNWYSIENSFGIYPSGLNQDGSKSNYRGNVKSIGIAYAGITKKWNKHFTLNIWNVLADQVMNTAMFQLDFIRKSKNPYSVIVSAQVIRQDGLAASDTENRQAAYFPPKGKSIIYGVKTGLNAPRFETSLNYTRITSAGRYLMPREWGRDPLFTFLPRERNEGLGDVHAIVGKFNYKVPAHHYSISLGVGYYDLPDVLNTRLNKYGMPSYTQINLDFRYTFTGFLEGLDLQYLLASKFNAGNTYGNEKYVFNKVDMQVHNLVLNYHF